MCVHIASGIEPDPIRIPELLALFESGILIVPSRPRWSIIEQRQQLI